MERIKYTDLPRATKKALKRKLLKTIDKCWRPKEVSIKEVTKLKPSSHIVPDYKNLLVVSYRLA